MDTMIALLWCGSFTQHTGFSCGMMLSISMARHITQSHACCSALGCDPC